jgi:hypothetical protein
MCAPVHYACHICRPVAAGDIVEKEVKNNDETQKQQKTMIVMMALIIRILDDDICIRIIP